MTSYKIHTLVNPLPCTSTCYCALMVPLPIKLIVVSFQDFLSQGYINVNLERLIKYAIVIPYGSAEGWGKLESSVQVYTVSMAL